MKLRILTYCFYQHQGDKEQLHEMSEKLSNLLTEESSNKRLKTSYKPTRHGRFGGSYTLDFVSNG